MPTFCLIPKLAEQFKGLIKSGEIDIAKLNDMTSKQRHDFFAKTMGERNAKEVNALFESKLLLKNQKRGLVTWAKQITGMKPEMKNTLIDKINRMDKILSPEDESKFLQDLASKRLGTDISIDEAKKIMQLSDKIKSLENHTNIKERISYGRARIDLLDYVNKLNGKKLGFAKNVLGLPRAVMASLDLSAPLNQGWGMLSRKQFYTNLGTMLKAAKSDNAFRDIQAEILTRPTFKGAKKAGLRINDLGQNLEQREEAFMTTLIDKIPGMNASQRAYTGFLNKLRMDVYDDLLKKAEIAGEDVGLDSKVLKDIADVVNTFTGGAGKANPVLNATFFSPRKMVSTFNMLNPKTYISPKISKTARKAAIRNLLGSVAITTSIVKLADVLGGDAVEVESDPRSSDFGSIKVGNTRLDLSGGNKTYANLITRIATMSSKSTMTGAVTPIGSKIGQTSFGELIYKFGRNKLSPLASMMVDIKTGENSLGEPKTATQSVVDRFKPMFINSAYELLKDDPKLAAMVIPALLGAGLSTYSVSENWSDKATQEMTQFKEKVGDDKFKEANNKYNTSLQTELETLKQSQEYKNKTPENKVKEITKLKDKLKKDIFKEYGFKKKTLPKKK